MELLTVLIQGYYMELLTVLIQGYYMELNHIPMAMMYIVRIKHAAMTPYNIMYR
jgi:hypothetical protein